MAEKPDPAAKPATESGQQMTVMLSTLKEAQDTVRGYDTKAQICGIGYIFALNIVNGIGDRIPNPIAWHEWNTLVAWAFIVVPIIMFGMVLYPTRKVAPKLVKRPEDVRRTVYVNTDEVALVDAYLANVADSEPRREVAFEIIKVSLLRELKRQRFLRALYAAGVSFLFLFAAQMLRSYWSVG